MTPRAALTQLGKMIAADMVRHGGSGNAHEAGQTVASLPGSSLLLLDLIISETGKKRPKDAVVSAYILMLGAVLEQRRYQIERHHAEADQEVAELRRHILAAGRAGRLQPGILTLVLRQILAAKLELGAEVQAMMASLAESGIRETPSPSGAESPSPYLSEMLAAFDGDIFPFFEELAENAATFPPEKRMGMAGVLLGSKVPAVREAAIGWLLDEAAEVRAATAGILADAASAGLVSGNMLRRLITLRNWLPAAERPMLDIAIKAARMKGLETAPVKAPKPGMVVVTEIDGSGAQSLFVTAREGRKHAIAALLVKFGAGSRDAWVRRDMTKRDMDDFMWQIESQTSCGDSSLDYVSTVLGHFLTVNADAGTLPPFGLLDFVETAGLGALNPKALALEDLIAMLRAEISADPLSPDDVTELLKESAAFAAPDSWFEDDAALASLLAGKRLSAKKQAARILSEFLPTRRRHWAELCAWTALSLRQEPGNDDWEAFAVVAGELLNGRKLEDIGLMAHVAQLTVEALHAR